MANVVLFALVIAGPESTVNVKDCEAGVPTPLLAVNVKEYVPPVPAAGVPPSAPVPFPLSANVTPLGSAPVSVSAGEGDPVVVTKNSSTEPTSNVVLLALVKAGDVPPVPLVTVRVNDCVAAVPTPFPAVIVKL
jgi:hypothetical protein